MPHDNPHARPEVLSAWGMKWFAAWEMFGKLDGRNATHRHPEFMQATPRKWQQLWDHMYYNVWWPDGDIEGWSPQFARDCYKAWLYGYNNYHDQFLQEDLTMSDKRELIQDLWYEFQETEPPEIDRWWL